MGPADHVINPRGSSDPSTVVIFGLLRLEFGGSIRREPPPYGARTSCWSSERVILKPVTVVTSGLLRLEFGGSIKRETRRE